VFKVLPVRWALPEHKVQQARLAPPGRKEPKARSGLPERLACKVLPARWALPGLLALQAPPALRVLKV